MHVIPSQIERLILEFGKLPGIGPKSASRLAFYMTKADDRDSANLGEALVQLKVGLELCSICFNFSEQSICSLCQSEERRTGTICVVEEPLDIVAVEKSGSFRGRYHVLHGAIAPIEGIGPEQLKVRELVERLRDEPVEEVILATNPNLEGEATALYIHKLIAPLVPKVTRLASGLPMGGDVEYADELTLSRALEGRREY